MRKTVTDGPRPLFNSSPDEKPSSDTGGSSNVVRVAKRSLFTGPAALSSLTPPFGRALSPLALASGSSSLSNSDRRLGEATRKNLFAGSPFSGSLLSTEELLPLDGEEELKDLDSALAEGSSRKKPKITDEQKEFKELCTGLDYLARFKRNDQHYDLDEVRGAKGSFMQAYRVSPDSPPLVKEIDNRTLLVKLFHREIIQTSPYQLQLYMDNALSQYRQLSNKKEEYPFIELPEIYNESTAKQDGYYIQKYIPYAIDTTKWAGSCISFEELDEKSQRILTQVRKYMRLMEKEEILMDLKPDNFRRDNEGTIYLIDFAEDFDEDTGISLIPCLSQALNLWSAGNQNICDFLNEGTEIKYLKDYQATFRVVFAEKAKLSETKALRG